jgi:Amt family ammonium transporter
MALPMYLLALWLATNLAAAGTPGPEGLRAEVAQLREELRQELRAEFDEKLHRLEARRLQDEEHSEEQFRRLSAMPDAMTHSWLILCGALVMFMHAGFAMLETGSCRAKNASNVLMKNLVNVCVGTLGWYVFGWMIAYGSPADPATTPQVEPGGNGFMGTDGWFAKDFATTNDDGIIQPYVSGGTSTYLSWFFQWAFCTAAATIVSGAVAERVLSPTYAAYAFVMASFIYPVVVGWTWGYGWISNLFDGQVIDFAGSGIVHMTGGVSGLAGTVVLGPRKGRFENPDEFVPHSLPLVVLGTFILWFGWYGFNCGSTLGMDPGSGVMAAAVAMNTTISAATGGITVFFLRYGLTKTYDVGGLCNGILAGLVSITAPCGNVEPGSALAIGLIGAFVYQASSMLLVKLKIDDPVDAVPVHGFCGMWGVIAAVLFDWGKGFEHFHGWSGFACVLADDGINCADDYFGKAFGAHIVMIIMIILWSGTLSGLTFFVLKMTGTLRIDEKTEDIGVDAAKHSPPKAYTMGNPTSGETPNMNPPPAFG